MIVARSGAELGNNEWLEKLQCSSGVPIQKRSAPLRRNCLIVARWHGAERGNNEWLEKLQCSSGVSHQCQKRSAPLRSNWEMYE